LLSIATSDDAAGNDRLAQAIADGRVIPVLRRPDLFLIYASLTWQAWFDILLKRSLYGGPEKLTRLTDSK
jgi:hypothetical protein